MLYAELSRRSETFTTALAALRAQSDALPANLALDSILGSQCASLAPSLPIKAREICAQRPATQDIEAFLKLMQDNPDTRLIFGERSLPEIGELLQCALSDFKKFNAIAENLVIEQRAAMDEELTRLKHQLPMFKDMRSAHIAGGYPLTDGSTRVRVADRTHSGEWSHRLEAAENDRASPSR